MSLPDDSPPPLPPSPPPRDPLLDDPAFAEIVGPAPAKPPAVPEPLYAEPVEEPSASDLPVAEVVPAPQAKAFSVRAVTPTVPAAPFPGPGVETEPPKGRWLAACGVIGCLGVAVIACIAALAWIAITILSSVGGKVGERKKEDPPAQYKAGIRPGPIAPTKIEKDDILELPGRFDAMGRGAGGRYLFLRIPSSKALAVFDANEGAVIKLLPLDDSKALFAAGASKLYLYKPTARTLERYSLLTWQRELSVAVPKGSEPEALALGSNSYGPVYWLAFDDGAHVRPLEQLTLGMLTSHTVPDWKAPASGYYHVRTSDSGALSATARDRGALRLEFRRLEAPQAFPVARGDSTPPLFATPAPEGHLLYTPRGVYLATGEQMLGKGKGSFFTFPTAHHSGLYLSLDVTAQGQVRGSPRLHAVASGDLTSLIALDQAELSGDLPANVLRPLTPDQRVQFWPGAGLLAVLPTSNTAIELYKIDVARALKQSPKPYVVFDSTPETLVHRSIPWRYKPTFWTRDDSKPRLELLEKPNGMQLQRDGTLVWLPPAEFFDPATVCIRAISLTGQYSEQRFSLAIPSRLIDD